MSEILTAKQASEMLQLSQEVLYRLLSKGVVPAFRVGGQWRMIRDDLITWARGQYACAAVAPSHKEGICHTNVAEAATGGSLSKEYDKLLAQKSTRTRKHLKVA